MLELYKEFKDKFKSGKLEEFRKHVMKNGLLRDLVIEGFTMTFGVDNPEEHETMEALSTFELKLLRDEYGEKLGKELMDKCTSSIIGMKDARTKLVNLKLFRQVAWRIDTPEAVQRALELFNIATTPNMVVGMHVVGEKIGEKISKQGILLSGDKFLGSVVKEDSLRTEPEEALSRNIEFFRNDPIVFLAKVMSTDGYNVSSEDLNHVMIVSIPKEELSSDNTELIVGPEEARCLNPKYINGYVEIDTQLGKLEGFKKNSRYVEKIESSGQPQSVADLTVQDWEKMFEDWYKEANKNKFQKILSKVGKFLRDIAKRHRGQKQIADHSVGDVDK